MKPLQDENGQFEQLVARLSLDKAMLQDVLRKRVVTPPLHRSCSECANVVLPVDEFTTNGQQCLIRLSPPQGTIPRWSLETVRRPKANIR